MALHLLVGHPSTQQPLLSHAFQKPSETRLPFPFSIPQISNARSRGTLFSHQNPPITATLNSSLTTATTTGVESQENPGETRTRLIAMNVPWTCTAEDMKNLFGKFGAVSDVELSMYNNTRNRGLAFITMASEEDALAALSHLNSYELDGRVIKVEFARSLKKKNTSPVTPDPVPKYNVLVGNLAWGVSSRDLRELFGDNSNILSADVIYQSNPRKPAGYGFVSFDSKEEADAAIATFNGKRLMGRPVRLVLGKIQTDDSEAKSYEVEQFDETSTEVNTSGELSNQADDECEEKSTEA